MLENFLSPKRLIAILRRLTASLKPAEALKYLFEVDRGLYELESVNAVRFGEGIHPKHRLINYHKFFTDNLTVGQKVLDIGCSSGELTFDLAKKVAPGRVIGVELFGEKVEKAKAKYRLSNLIFIFGDALKELPNENFDVIILSNVLEHLDKRVEFLKKLKEKYQPKYFLIRVPMFERDWRVPLKKEIGLDYRLDATHYIEYRHEELAQELDAAGLVIEIIETNWGEYWLKAK